MTIRNGDMPAMPLPNDAVGLPYVIDDYDIRSKRLAHGLSKREQFAIAAMQGLLASFGQHDVTEANEIASDSVLFADALLAELDKAGGE